MNRISKEELELLRGTYKQPKTVLELAIHNTAEELKRFRDLEEQGRLIEQKHGRWIRTGAISYRCSECNYLPMETDTAYCPNCGAKMDELKGTEDE